MNIAFLANSRNNVQREIEEDRQLRKKAFKESIEKLRNHVERRCLNDIDNEVSRFEKSVWTLLMSVGLQAVLWYMASKRQLPTKNKMLGSDGRIYKCLKEKSYELRSIFGQGTYMASQYRRGEKIKRSFVL